MSKIKHIALFRFNDGVSPEDTERVLEEMVDLSENVPGIEDYVAGPNNSPENLADGFTHAFVMTFTDTAARDAFLTHPENERFKSTILPQLSKVVVVDFEV